MRFDDRWRRFPKRRHHRTELALNRLTAREAGCPSIGDRLRGSQDRRHGVGPSPPERHGFPARSFLVQPTPQPQRLAMFPSEPMLPSRSVTASSNNAEG